MKFLQFNIDLAKKDTIYSDMCKVDGIKRAWQGIMNLANPELNKISFCMVEDNFDQEKLKTIDGIEPNSISLLYANKKEEP